MRTVTCCPMLTGAVVLARLPSTKMRCFLQYFFALETVGMCSGNKIRTTSWVRPAHQASPTHVHQVGLTICLSCDGCGKETGACTERAAVHERNVCISFD